jgi:hypothetical protein
VCRCRVLESGFGVSLAHLLLLKVLCIYCGHLSHQTILLTCRRDTSTRKLGAITVSIWNTPPSTLMVNPTFITVRLAGFGSPRRR